MCEILKKLVEREHLPASDVCPAPSPVCGRPRPVPGLFFNFSRMVVTLKTKLTKNYG
jgi:hypothetical protein